MRPQPHRFGVVRSSVTQANDARRIARAHPFGQQGGLAEAGRRGDQGQRPVTSGSQELEQPRAAHRAARQPVRDELGRDDADLEIVRRPSLCGSTRLRDTGTPRLASLEPPPAVTSSPQAVQPLPASGSGITRVTAVRG